MFTEYYEVKLMEQHDSGNISHGYFLSPANYNFVSRQELRH